MRIDPKDKPNINVKNIQNIQDNSNNKSRDKKSTIIKDNHNVKKIRVRFKI
jgi:hypothetical protein